MEGLKETYLSFSIFTSFIFFFPVHATFPFERDTSGYFIITPTFDTTIITIKKNFKTIFPMLRKMGKHKTQKIFTQNTFNSCPRTRNGCILVRTLYLAYNIFPFSNGTHFYVYTWLSVNKEVSWFSPD